MSAVADDPRENPLAQPVMSSAAATAALSVAAIAFALSVALPLATYTTTLACFGLAHVAYELRYVAWRFAARLQGRFLLAISLLIAVAVVSRGLALTGLIPRLAGTALELACAAALAALPALCMRRHRLLALAIALPFAAGAVLAPFEALLLLAVLHNLTPLALLADVLKPPQRAPVMAIAAIFFLGLPLLIASGWPGHFAEILGLSAAEATLFRAGALDDNIGAFIPEQLDNHPRVVDFFAAAVFAQCMHYLAVIWLLPRIMRRDRAQKESAAPARRLAVTFALAVAAASIILIAAYAVDYGLARKLYALIALVHAWLEIPVLVMALDMDRPGHEKGMHDA